MKIAVLAWGSLVWDKRTLRIVGDWQAGGPVLHIEFSRVSGDGRLTLVIDPQNGVPVTTLFARSEFENLNDAIANLRERENNPPTERIGYVDLVHATERDYSRRHHPSACDSIKAWANEHDLQAVIWTALVSNFVEKCSEPLSADAAIRHVNGLNSERKKLAVEYINKAPPQVDTPFRRQFQTHQKR